MIYSFSTQTHIKNKTQIYWDNRNCYFTTTLPQAGYILPDAAALVLLSPTEETSGSFHTRTPPLLARTPHLRHLQFLAHSAVTKARWHLGSKAESRPVTGLEQRCGQCRLPDVAFSVTIFCPSLNQHLGSLSWDHTLSRGQIVGCQLLMSHLGQRWTAGGQQPQPLV